MPATFKRSRFTFHDGYEHYSQLIALSSPLPSYTGCFFVYKGDMDVKQWIGIVAGLLTSISMLPQLIKIIKEKKAKEISLLMLSVLTTGNILWAVYGFLRDDWPIIITNFISITINSITAFYRIRYKDR
jgi:MtN3 and saliva related transmembrane protein